MATFDIILIALLIFAFIRGLMKGFVMELAALLGVAISVIIAKNFGDAILGGILSLLNWQTEVNHMVSFAIVFLIAMIAVRFAAMLVAKLVKFAMLGWLDKLLGGALCLVKWLMIFGVLLYAFDRINNYANFFSPEELAKSKLYEPVKSLAYVVFPAETDGTETTLPDTNSVTE